MEEPSDGSYVKLVILGSGGVGKSCITLRFTTGKFPEEYLPTIEDSYRKCVSVDDEPVTIDILDTAGQEEYGSLLDVWARSGHGYILVFDVTMRTTFEEVFDRRLRILRHHEDEAETEEQRKSRVPIVLVGNKSDLVDRREVPYEEAKAQAEKWGISYVETSALQGINVDVVFFNCVREVRARIPPKPVKKKRFWCSIL